jgi:hypothetical protein
VSTPSPSARDTVFVAGRHHIETASGRYVDLLNPGPATITLQDIAHHLAQANRYAGAARRPLSVAEHTLLVADRLWSQGHAARTILLGLHHDDAEAYAQDLTRPLKLALDDYPPIERALGDAVRVALSLPASEDGDGEAIRAADDWALAAEAYFLLPSRGEGWFCWGLYDPLDGRNPRASYGLATGDPPRWETLRDAWLDRHDYWLRAMERASA